MAPIPKSPMLPTVAAIFRSYELRSDPPRAYLGASVIGKPCERQLWYSFRWCYEEKFEGRMMRLFERGQREEEALTRELRAVGVTLYTVDPRTGLQFRFNVIGGHVGGSMDAMGIGFAEAPKTYHVVEFKTHNDKSFTELQAKSVQAAKPEHWAQMQLYMHWSEMERAYYLAVNKNTDAIYGERVRYDKAEATRLAAKAERIVRATEPPPKLSDNPAWYQCKMCRSHSICHGNKLPIVSCRTCLHITPELDGKARWSCAHYKCDISEADQRTSHICPSHRYIPALVTYAKQIDADPENNSVTYQLPSGKTFRNAQLGIDSYGSEELRNVTPEIFADLGISKIRDKFDSRVVEAEAA